MKNGLAKDWRKYIALLLILVLFVASGHATDGCFDFGYGVKAKGIGGAGVAFPQDSLAPATNPAGKFVPPSQSTSRMMKRTAASRVALFAATSGPLEHAFLA